MISIIPGLSGQIKRVDKKLNISTIFETKNRKNLFWDQIAKNKSKKNCILYLNKYYEIPLCLGLNCLSSELKFFVCLNCICPNRLLWQVYINVCHIFNHCNILNLFSVIWEHLSNIIHHWRNWLIWFFFKLWENYLVKRHQIWKNPGKFPIWMKLSYEIFK